MQNLKKNLSKKVNFFLDADSKVIYVACSFFVILLTSELYNFNLGFFDFFYFLKRNHDYIVIILAFFYFLLSLYFAFLFVLITISSKWRYRIIYLLFFFVCSLAEYSYQKALGRPIRYFDFPVILDTTSDQKLDTFVAFFNWYSLVPFGLLVLICLLIKPIKNEFGGKVFLIFGVAVIAFYLNLSYFNHSLVEKRFPNLALASFSQTLADYAQYGNSSGKGKVRRENDVEKPVTPFRLPANNIVVVFDESVRSDHLSLNGYKRPTTPFLEKLRDERILKNYGTASSVSTASHSSYDGFIIGLTSNTLFSTNKDEVLNTLPTIFQYAKAMNYKTHFYDGQMKYPWGSMRQYLEFIDNLQTMSEIDNPERIEDYEQGRKITGEDNRLNTLKQWEIDNKIARMVKETISTSTGNFIFIYKRGVHFPYEKNYPEDATIWSPIFRFSEQWQIPPAEEKPYVINSYDNAILFNLDSFFKNLVDDYSAIPNNTNIIYTSDHGQSFEGGGKAPHGGKTSEEANVPLFIINNSVDQFDTEYKSAHENIFPTVLDLMEYPQELRKPKYALSLLKAKKEDSKLRNFLPDLKEKVPFIETE